MDRIMNRITIIGAFVVLIGLMMGSTYAKAETPAEFFQGKNLMIVTNQPAGGLPDLITRTVAPFLAQEIGAKIRIENRKIDETPNYVYTTKTRDGLLLGIQTTDGIIANEILKAPGVRYEAEKFNYIAEMNPSVKIVQISPKLPYKTLDALRKAKGLRGGGTSARGSAGLSAAVMLEILGLDGKVISGFNGIKEVALAVARGELDLLVKNDATADRDEKDGLVVNLVTTGDRKSNVVPNVPTLSELGVKVPADMESALEFAGSVGTGVYMPPGVPQERVEYIRQVFQRLSSNKDLQKAMAKVTGNESDFISGKDVQKRMVKMKADKGLVTKLDALFDKYTAVR